MRISCLYINFSRGWGGLEMFSANLFEWLSGRGHTIIFLVRRGTKLHERAAGTPFAERVVALSPLPYIDPRVMLIIRKLLRQHAAAIIHTFKSSDVSFSVLATLSLLKPRAKRVHHLQMLPKRRRRDPLHTFLYRRLDLLLTITEQIAERARRLWPVKPEAVRTLYHGIDPQPYRAAAARAEQLRGRLEGRGRPLLGIVGQICEIKGQLLVLKAFAELRAAPPQARLIIAGAPAPGSEAYEQQIRRFIDERGLASAVELPGFCEDVPALLAALDVFVLGSRAEPFGLVVLEAMAAGVPVVASNAGGIPEMISDGENGILYRAEDEQSLLEALARACALSGEERRRIVGNAQRVVDERFSLNRFIAQITGLYEQLQAVTSREYAHLDR